MQGDGEQEYADYQAECDAEAQAGEAEGEYLARMEEDKERMEKENEKIMCKGGIDGNKINI